MDTNKAVHEFSPGCLCDDCRATRRIPLSVIIRENHVLRQLLLDILADHDERVALYPEMNNQDNRVRVMETARAFLTEKHGEESKHG